DYRVTIFIYNLQFNLCNTSLSANRCAASREDLNGVRPLAGLDVLTNDLLAVVIQSNNFQFSSGIRDVPINNSMLIVVGLGFTNDFPVEFQSCLRADGVSYHAYLLSLLVVPDWPSIHRWCLVFSLSLLGLQSRPHIGSSTATL